MHGMRNTPFREFVAHSMTMFDGFLQPLPLSIPWKGVGCLLREVAQNGSLPSTF